MKGEAFWGPARPSVVYKDVPSVVIPGEDGVNLVVIQTLLGHAHLRTTAGYLHLSDIAVRSTRSPLELLGSLDLVRVSKP